MKSAGKYAFAEPTKSTADKSNAPAMPVNVNNLYVITIGE